MPMPILKRLSPLLWLLGLWLVLVGLFAGQFIVGGREWEQALEGAVRFWLPWLPLLPVTAWLSKQFPLDRARPALNIAIHIAACAAVVFICQEFTPERGPNPNREGVPRGEPGEPGERPPRDGGPPPWARGPRPGSPAQEEMRGPSRRGPGRPFINIRSIIDIVVYGGVVSLTHTIAILRRSRQRERRALELEASLARARLDALRLQINPHFLFNTLNAIASLIHTRPGIADEMIGSLSELLRAT